MVCDNDCETITEECRTEVEIPSVTKVITEIKCKPPKYGKIKHYDAYTDGVPPNNQYDVLNMTPSAIQESADMFLQRARRNDMRFIYICIIILNILFLVSAIFGITSTWYQNLKKDNISAYLIGSLWLVSAILSYGAIFMLWENIKPDEIKRDIRISVYFLIGCFLNVLWAGVFFQGNDLRWGLWLAALLFLYSFWLLIYIWIIKPIAGLLMLPLVVMYGYFFYYSVHVASLNNTAL
jgi:tryptophan-rich sensory protein